MRTYYIYRITNLLNLKTYIGQKHCPENKAPESDKYMGSGKIIKFAEKKYGVENFKKDILAISPTKKMTDFLEKAFIAAERQIRGKENCYNIADGGDGGDTGVHWNKGLHATQEQKQKQREKMLGKPSAWKGKHFSAKQREIISQKTKEAMARPDVRNKQLKGQSSAEYKSKESLAHLGSKNGMFGKHVTMSAETKAKLIAANKGKHHSAETCEKIKKNTKKLWENEDYRNKQIASHTGKPNWKKGKHLVIDENGKRIWIKQGE